MIWFDPMVGFRRFVFMALGIVFACSCGSGQERYSTSAEYQQMMQEVRQPAPSPVFLATGHRPQADARLRARVHENSRSVRIDTEGFAITLDKASAAVTIANARTQAVWTITQPPAAGCASAALSVSRNAGHSSTWTLTRTPCETATVELLGATTARITYNTSAHALQVRVAGTIPLFGLGERFWQASLANTSLDVRPADKFGERGHAWTYVAVPFVLSPGGLGMYADTAFDSGFRFDEAGSSFDVRVANNPVSFYFFAGVDAKAVLTAYTGLTGRPQEPPLWTFGPWINAVQGPDAVINMAQRIHTDGIPASALWVFDVMDEPNNLGWPFWFSSYYRDPRLFVEALHRRGYKVLNYVHPYLRERMLPYSTLSPAYQEGIVDKLLVTAADGLPAGPRFEPVRTGNIDFTNPAAVDWWQKTLTAAVREQGFDGWMEDFGEWVADSDSFAAGKGSTLAEVYPLLYHKITMRIARGLNPDLVSFSRSGSSGSQQFSPVLWGADQSHNWSRDYGLPSVVTAGITAGMSGFSTWGPDILSDGDSKELWMRWAEFGALTPVMRDHVWAKPQYSVNLWYDAETEALFKKYAILHTALLPYFATYAAEAHRTGVPIMRHTVLEYPDDARSYDCEYQYLLGKQLLVAPVVEPGATTRALYLPRGEWVDYWSGVHYEGGRDVTVPAPIEQIPLLVRAGSVLPFKPEAETAALNWNAPQLLAGSLVWRIFLGSGEEQEGQFALPDGTSAQMVYHSGVVVLEVAATTVHAYEVVVRSASMPRSLRLQGAVVEPADKEIAAGQGSGWWYDSVSHEVHVSTRATNFRLEIAGFR